jgi:predicted patatin/cPLA2 family phospholipase
MLNLFLKQFKMLTDKLQIDTKESKEIKEFLEKLEQKEKSNKTK